MPDAEVTLIQLQLAAVNHQ